jgi:hypothetical protein
MRGAVEHHQPDRAGHQRRTGRRITLSRDIIKSLGIPPERTVEFNASLREPSDILGIPFKSLDASHSQWLPPEEMYSLRAGTGRCALILEEYSDGIMAMQNALCRVILDRHAGQMPLSKELYIIGTGNRTEDKSGANRVSTKFHTVCGSSPTLPSTRGASGRSDCWR